MLIEIKDYSSSSSVLWLNKIVDGFFFSYLFFVRRNIHIEYSNSVVNVLKNRSGIDQQNVQIITYLLDSFSNVAVKCTALKIFVRSFFGTLHLYQSVDCNLLPLHTLSTVRF